RRRGDRGRRPPRRRGGRAARGAGGRRRPAGRCARVRLVPARGAPRTRRACTGGDAMRLTVNGLERELSSPPLEPLLHALREEPGVTGRRAGGREGGCGACTVLVDGEPRRACLVPLVAVEGAHVTTAEALGEPGKLSPVQAAFHEQYGAQCGFCTPGFVMATT